MNFTSFLVLLVISIMASAVLHFVCKYYIVPGFNSFLAKVVFGWFGAWQGTPVFGKWFEGLEVEGVYIIPALLGAFVILVMLIDLTKSFKGVKK